MKKIFFIFLCVYVQTFAYTISNEHITFSVNPETGTIGTGLETNAVGLVYGGTEYLNEVGIPFEFFSLKVDNSVYANDNSEGYRGTWPPKGLRTNVKNIPTNVKQNGNTIIAQTTMAGKFRIIHRYRIGNGDSTSEDTTDNMQRNISVEVTVENLSSHTKSMKYTRGIDMDPPDIDTKNSMGYREQGKTVIPRDNIVYTISAKNPGQYPLTLFSEHKLSHTGAILPFKNFKGCLYDPDNIIKKSIDPYNGDGVIYMIFDLGKVSPGESKTFSFSYYLDDNLKELIMGRVRKNPKLIITPSALQFNLRHHDKEEEILTRKRTFSLHPTNKEFRDNKKSKEVTVELVKGSVIPKGASLVVDGAKLFSNGEKKIKLPKLYAYDTPIPLWVKYNKDWKENSVKKLQLMIGTSEEAGRYSQLDIQLNPLKDNTIIIEGEDQLNFDIPYGESKSYEPIAQKTILLKSKASKAAVRHAKMKIVASQKLPNGLRLKINGSNLEEVFTYRFGKPVSITLERNVEYVEKEVSNIDLILLDEDSGQSIPLKVSMNPLSRELDIVISPIDPSVRLDKLEESNETIISLFANGKRIEGDSFSAYQLKVDCDELNCKLKKDEENHQFLLKVSPELIMALTATGEIPINLTLKKGFFPNDKAEKEFIYTVEDIGWKKWIDPLINLILLLILLWYLWGITGGKKKFKKNQVVTHTPIHRGKIDRDAERDYRMRSLVPWWDTLIPYRSQRAQVEDLRFIALKNRQIYLVKRSQTDVIYNGLEIDDPGMKEMRLYPGDALKTYQALYTIL